ncbi:serine/threonine-protein kinase [Streptomyces sp. GbtcB6]|uniref:serine/threonine-protein kinase n=1 Tax=Streptomyces sp. GbtcB6 TaxID=2824751 RepID=UPI001C306FBE|nr:serine/threonine-protein kinase [Streptomyces sp. GbtcB6]
MSEDGEQPVEGRLIGGRYRLAERIGSGPTSTVWRARDEQDARDGRHVAVKELRLTGEPADEERQRAAHRLLHEARAAARVDHPAAVAIHDVLLDGERPWIVMELVTGESLHAALAARGPLPPAEAARIGLAVLGALHAAHCVGIVHRDLKPSNVLLEAGGERVVVTDFGIGAAQQEPCGGDFVAPECGAGRGAGPASDLWSLGALLRTAMESTEGEGPLGPLLQRLRAPEPEARPAAADVAEVLAEAAGVSLPEWVTAPPAPAPAVPVPAAPASAAPTAAPVSPPTAPEPRRLTPLAALGLLLAKKPERG